LNWDYQLGDFLILRKKHPCGSFRWEVLRVGADIRLLCTGCGRMIMLPRHDLERRIKSVEKSTSTP
jgi:hypothetical protein